MQRFIFLILTILFGINLPVFACDYCLLAQGISPLETSHGIGLRIDQRYTRLATLFDHGKKIMNSDELETHWTTQLTAFYSVSPKISLIGIVPFARRFEREGEEDHQDHVDGQLTYHQGFSRIAAIQHGSGAAGSSFGLSDITLLGRFQAYQRHSLTSTFIASLQAGVRIPTGKTDALNDNGEVLDAHIQPGTGAFSYLFGVSTSYALSRLSVVANGVFSIATEGNFGDDSYEFGNALNYDAAIRFRLNASALSGANVFASFGIAGEWRENELLNGTELEQTGGNTLYITPGFQIFFQSVVFEVSFWQAVGHDLNGEQLGENFKTFAGITYLIR